MRRYERSPSGAERLPPTIGAYRIIGVLGRGGMGIVYRGEHEETREAAAVKTVFSVDESLVASIRREIHALQRARHPGVVRIVAEGVDAGRPWYAMELLEGRTLRDHLDQPLSSALSEEGVSIGDQITRRVIEGELLTASRPAPPEVGPSPSVSATRVASLCAILRDLCAPLSFLHGNGIVHRDLKPENIFVRPDGTPVLVDLGLAALSSGALGREQLENAGDTIGTLAYMAPEQIRGELVDARTDLYALGCILYEGVVGAPPFVSPDPLHVLRAHQLDPPIPASKRVDGVPPAIDRLILRLLAKRPSDRPGFADDVAAILARGTTGPEPTVEPRPVGLPYLYRPDFVGHEAALGELLSTIETLSLRRRGGRIYLGGESGVGKTRLAMEAVRAATQRKITVILGQCTSLGLGAGDEVHRAHAPLEPFVPFLQAVADRCRRLGPLETERLLGGRIKRLSTYQPALLDLPGATSSLEPVTLDPQAARGRVLTDLAATLFAFAETRPVVLVLDDLHWADELTGSFLLELSTRELSMRGVLVLGTYRMEELRGERRRLLDAKETRVIEIGRLAASDVGAMVSGMLALDEPPSPLVDFLHRRCDGNPFFIAEYLRAAIAGGLLTRDHAGRWGLTDHRGPIEALDDRLPLPRTLAALIEHRLAALDPDGLALVRAAAVLGRAFAGDLLAAATAMGGDAGLDALAALRVRQIIEETGGNNLRFVHDTIREIAYASIPAAERSDLHRRAALAIEAQRPGAAELDPVLAHHFATAQIHDRAAFYFARAGEHARRAYANGEAIAFYRAAIREEHARADESARASPSAALAAWYEGLGDLASLTGEQPEAREAYAEALARSTVGVGLHRARLCRKVGKTWEIHQMHENAQLWYADAEAALGDAPAPPVDAWWHEWVQIHIDRLWVSYWLNRVDEMNALVAQVWPEIDERGTPYQEVRFFQLLVMRNLRVERYLPSAETLKYAREAMALSNEVGDLGQSAAVRFVLFFALVLHGSLDEAEPHGLAVLRAAEQTGSLTLQARCLAYLAVIARRRGDVEATRRWGAACLVAAESGKIVEYLGLVRANAAWIAWREGDLGEAARLAREALHLWRPQEVSYPLQWTALFPLLAADLAEGRAASAREMALALLDPKQQRLPDPLTNALEATTAPIGPDGASSSPTERTAALDHAALLAKEQGYL